MVEQASRTAPKCTACKEGRMLERLFPWKPKVALALKCTLVLWPMAMLLTAKPDFYECDRCGHQTGSLWM